MSFKVKRILLIFLFFLIVNYSLIFLTNYLGKIEYKVNNYHKCFDKENYFCANITEEQFSFIQENDNNKDVILMASTIDENGSILIKSNNNIPAYGRLLLSACFIHVGQVMVFLKKRQ